ncbi:MAG: glycosyltransferase [Elusimicrobia bacterium]|nr:glycosyltransferase [Elusimicrobiota bacterium]
MIIPTYNGRKLLAENLPSVLEECAGYGGDTEVIVVDDGSADGTPEFLAGAFPGVKVISRGENGGFSRAVNDGATTAAHPLVFLLNNDVRLTPGVLTALASCFERKDVFAAQARIITGPADEAADHLGLFSRRLGLLKYAYVPSRPASGPVEMDFASGGATMFSRDKFEALGLLDERFSPFYFEDLDICFRARSFGWRVLFQPAAKVYHLHPGSTIGASRGDFGRRVIHRKNYYLFMLKNAVGLANLPVFFLYAAYRAVRGGAAEAVGFLQALREQLSGAATRRMSSPGNIVYLDSPLAFPGGGQLSLLGILTSLRGYHPFVILSSGSALAADLAAAGIPYRVIGAGKTDMLGFIPEAFRILSSARPRLVHCNSGTTFFSFVFAAAARFSGIPFIWHNRVLETAGLKERLIAALSERVIVISKAVGRKFRALPRGKVVELPNAVDIGVFKPLPPDPRLFDELKLPCGAGVVGIFSRLDKWKGHELFFSAMRKVLARHPDCAVLVVGEGEERERLAALADETGLKASVRFLGHRRDIPGLMNICSVVVNPSVLPEPFGRTLIEGMACGKPVVATKMGGPLEIVADGVDGLLVEPESGALAAAIVRLLEDGAYASGLGAAARKKVEMRYDLRVQAAELADIYTKIMKGQRA